MAFFRGEIALAMKQIYRFAGVTVVGCLAALCSTASSRAFADRALVIGVNEYPGLGQGANLEGCVNDAQNIQKSLEKLGFEVTTLINEKATKAAIMSSFADVKKLSKPNERFVFYFAGHGTVTSDGSSALLPSDASEKSEANDLGRDDLYNAITAVPASSRTSLLDSCFSGGLSRKGLGHTVKKTRYFKRGAGEVKRRDLAESNNQDNNKNIAGKGQNSIIYFTASLANQTSGEDDFEGVRGGVFTHFLTSRLEKSHRDTHWNEVQREVTGQVSDYMDQTQTPKLSPTECADLPIFDGKDAPAPEPKPDPKPNPEPKPNPTPKPDRTLWDEFNEDRSDSSALNVTMAPNKASIKIKDQFSFKAHVGDAGGWLVLLEKDTDGKVYLLWPRTRKLDDAKVESGSIVRLPSTNGKSYTADAAGTERVKAILFTNEDNARALLSAFPAEGVEPSKLRRITEVGSERKVFYTSSLLFGVE